VKRRQQKALARNPAVRDTHRMRYELECADEFDGAGEAQIIGGGAR
jgi:hypothetical protein